MGDEYRFNTACMDYDSFFHLYQAEVMRYFISKCGNEEDAKDLFQETFTYCWRHFRDYDAQKASYRTWLYVVASSRLKNHYRSRKMNASLDDFADVLPDDRSDVENAVYIEDVRKALASALGELSEAERQIVILFYFGKVGTREIALRLGLSESNVRKMKERTIKKLEKQLM